MTTDLDTRVRAAAESLRRSVDAVPVPAARRRSPAALGAAAAVVAVVVLAGAAMLVLRNRDRSAELATGSTPVPRLIADPVPEGMGPSYAADLPLPEDEILPGSMSVTVYGDAAADDPFAGADLGILVVTDETLAVGGGPVTVRGQPGEATDNGRYGTSVTWDEAPGSEVTLASQTLERSQLLAIAEGLTIEGTAVALGPLPAGLPGALSEVGTATDMLVEGPLPVPRSAVGHVVEYRAEEGESRLAVGSAAGGASNLAVLRWSLQSNQVVDVRGGQGWLGRFPSEPGFPPITAVVWEESPGVIAVVAGDGMTEDELLAAAEILRPATDDEWAALLGQPHDSESGDDPSSATTVTARDNDAPGNQTAMTTPAGSVVSLHGTGDDHHPAWVVYIDGVGALCAESSDGTSGSASCGDVQQGAATLHDNAGNPFVVFGVMPNGAVNVDVEGDTGAAPHTASSPNGSTSIYALALDGRPVPAAVIFSDGQGRVIEVAAVDA
ncbi:MAG: hypothetical protein ACRD0W_13055 [Acidimicrobiales bacterium]